MDRVDLLWFGGGKEVDSRGLSRQSDFVLIIVAFGWRCRMRNVFVAVGRWLSVS